MMIRRRMRIEESFLTVTRSIKFNWSFLGPEIVDENKGMNKRHTQTA